MGLFKKAQAAPPPSETIKRLRETLEQLEKREKYLDTKVQAELDKAKLHVGTNKRAALMALKRKKLFEVQIDKMVGARTTLETQIIAIESASTNLVILDAMKEGGRVLNQINRKMTVEQVEDTMDEIQDQMTVATEISDAISMPLSGNALDDEELNAELEELQAQALGKELRNSDRVIMGGMSMSDGVIVPNDQNKEQAQMDPWNSLEMEMEI